MRMHHPLAALIGAAVLLAVPALADPYEGQGEEQMSPEMAAMMEVYAKAGTPGEPHAGLAEMAGTWQMEVKFWMEPGGEPTVSTVSATRQMIMGGRYLEEKVEGESFGQPFQGYGLIGYDNVSGEYWNLWLDNMGTGYMLSRGKKDDSGRIVYHGSYPNAMTGGRTECKSVHSVTGEGKETFEMWEDRGGEMVKTMEITSTRQ